jgi:hypothetical protein
MKKRPAKFTKEQTRSDKHGKDKDPKSSKGRNSRNRTLERVSDKMIIDTLEYKAIFNASVSFYQLGTLLLSVEGDKDYEIDHKTLTTRLKNLKRARKIKEKKGKYYISQNPPLSWELRAKYSSERIKDKWFVFELLKTIKWIKFLGISGSVAAYNAGKNDDVDIFIITERHRMWLTRFFVVLLLKIIGVYRTEASPHNKVCPNIYVDEESVTWPYNKQNVYTANEVVMLQPIIDRDDTYLKFLKHNSWVFNYLPNFKVNFPPRFKRSTKYNSRLVDNIEFWIMLLQLWYMYRKKTTEITSRNFIHFNKYDHAEKILSAFEN